MTLQQEIENKRAEIKTESYAMSVGELINLYENNEIVIRPAFQRLFRWSVLQKSKLIESILLGFPIPPIFVSQRSDGIWEVVDGFERLPTIYEFVGKLKIDRDGRTEIAAPLTLLGTDYLPSLQGKRWEMDGDEDGKNTLTQIQQVSFRRSKLDIKIIVEDSTDRTKYELFQRLNSGGSILTDQEVRSAMLVGENPELQERIQSFSEDNNFRECIRLSDKSYEEQFDVELVLRFLVFRMLPENSLKIGDLSDFLTKRMLLMASNHNFRISDEEKAFRSTFKILFDVLSGDAFRRYDHSKNKFTGGFLLTPFEIVALGIGYNHKYWNDQSKDRIVGLVKELWRRGDIIESSGINSARRVQTTIPAGRELFKP